MGPHAQVNWARLRVTAESLFLATVYNEHLSLKDLSLAPTMLVGDVNLDMTSNKILVYQPTPGSIWSAEPQTFALTEVAPMVTKAARLPAAIMSGIRERAEVEAPAIVLRKAGVNLSWSQYEAAAPVSTSALIGALQKVRQASIATSSAGGSASRAMRRIVYDAVQSAPHEARMRLVRSVDVLAAMGVGDEPTVVTMLSRNLMVLNSHILKEMAEAAMRQGETVEDWFNHAVSRLPGRSLGFSCDTFGWASVAARHLIRQSDERWRALKYALEH